MTNPNGSNDLATAAKELFLEKFPQLQSDDPLTEMASWNALLERKVDDFGSRLDIWTNAILKQTDLATQQNQLIVSQNLTLQETSKNNATLGETLLQFKQGLSQLQMEFKTLKIAIDSHGTSLKSLSDKSQSLSGKLDNLSLKLATLDELTSLKGQVSKLSKSVNILKESLNSRQVIIIFFSAAILLVQILNLFAYKGLSQDVATTKADVATTKANLSAVRQRVDWALVKLGRLEKR